MSFKAGIVGAKRWLQRLSACCSCRGPRVETQASTSGSSQTPVTPVPGDLIVIPSGLSGHLYVHAQGSVKFGIVKTITISHVVHFVFAGIL